MTDTTTEAVERLAGACDNADYRPFPHGVFADTIRALAAERDALKAEVTSIYAAWSRERASAERAADRADQWQAIAEEMGAALAFYRDGFSHEVKRSKHMLLISDEWKPKPVLLDDCGEVALKALAKLQAMKDASHG